MKAVRKINKKATEVSADAATLKLTLVTQPELFHVGKGLGPFEGSYLLVLEHENIEEVMRTIEAIDDAKMALRVERTPAAEVGGEQVRIALQMAGMAARIYAHDIVLKSSTEVFIYSDDWAAIPANDYKQGGQAWLALRQFTGADVVGSPHSVGSRLHRRTGRGLAQHAEPPGMREEDQRLHRGGQVDRREKGAERR